MTIKKDAYEAMVRGDVQEFERLLRLHPDELSREPTGRILMHGAAGRGQLACVEVLGKHGIDVNVADGDEPQGALARAASEGHLHVVRWLLGQGAKVNYVVEGKTWCTALTGAISGGHLQVVKMLIEHGADVNANGPGLTPLGYALTYNHHEIASFLRSVGAKTAAELGDPLR